MRVAFFPDSFHEVNGVAHTARNYQAYAVRRGLPFLCVHAARPEVRGGTGTVGREGSVTTLDLPRSSFSIGMEKDLSFDPLFARHAGTVERTLREFRPDVIHITGPSELGIFGAYFAWKLRVPLAASWHTNVHEYAARRSSAVTRLLPAAHRWIEDATLAATARFYRLARVLYAPNEDLCDLLHRRTGRPCQVMRRGVDTDLFRPERRTREGGGPVLGYVGRLSVEKNISLLPEIERTVHAAGVRDARFMIVGQGGDEAALRAAMPQADFRGVQRGEALAACYADMDLFVFPSETDTFGNVVLEALSSGVPCAVSTGGGPKFIVRDGETGIVRPALELGPAIADLLQQPERLASMRRAARAYALLCRWDAIFDGIYESYLPLRSSAPAAAVRHSTAEEAAQHHRARREGV